MRKPLRKLTIVPASGAQAFAALEAEIAAVRDDALVKISVDISYAHQIAHAIADRIDALVPQLENLPGFDLERVLKIRVYATACHHAHLLATAPATTDPRLSTLLDEAAKLREDLLSTAELLARFGDVAAERVAAIRSGAGHIDMANDLEQLGVLFEEVWATAKSRVPVTRAMIERAPDLAHQLHVALGVKRVGTNVPSDQQRTRLRAYSLFVAAYREYQRGVRYLRSPFGDVDAYAPSIYAKQKRRSSRHEIDVPDADDPTLVLPPGAPTLLPTTELEPTG